MEAKQIEEVTLATKTYQVKNGRILSKVDGFQAMRQAIEKALLTARFSVPWLSKNYGNDLQELVGKSIDYSKMEIERMIKETFISDKRVTGIFINKIEVIDKTTLNVFATITTVFGDVPLEKEVNNDT